MDTANFLRLILPEGGHYFAFEVADGYPKQRHHTGVDALSKYIARRDAATTGNVYYAMATFKQESYVDAAGGEVARTQENVDTLKCFWVDLDCKGRANDYADQREAIKDVLRLCAETGLARPTALVNSGYGVHAYWVLDKAIPATTWMHVAKMWRATLDKHGIKHDSSCTTDSARVLRPVGAHNRKAGKGDMQVKLVGAVGTLMSLDDFVGKLGVATAPQFVGGLEFDDAGVDGADMSLNVAAAGIVEYQPSSVMEIVKECALLRAVAKCGGNVSEPLWHKVLGLVKHTTEGTRAIHAFSRGHPSYTHEATERKAAQWVKGPTTCEVLRQSSTEMPDHCANCDHSIVTPMHLGYRKSVAIEIVREVVAGKLVETPVEVEVICSEMSGEFKWEKGKLWRLVLDKEASKGEEKPARDWVAFCDFLVYPANYYEDENDKHIMVWRIHEREGTIKEFTLSGGALGSGGPTLFKELGERGITATNGRKVHMEAYLSKWCSETKKAKPSIETYLHYGWHGENFLLGNTMLMADGGKKEVRLGGDADLLKKHFAPKGTLPRWKELIDRAYNQLGQEQYQFLLGVGFGSPLIHLMNIAGGVAFSAVSYDSGQGKTTAGQMAVGIFGSGRLGDLALSKQQATYKAVFAMAGVMHNMPVMIDEATNMPAEELSDTLYTFSQGSPRIGCKQDGRLNHSRYSWASNMLQTSNKPMTAVITGSKPGADAELARLVEFTFENVSKLSKAESDEIFSELIDCHGHAGIEYMSYVVTHQAEVKDLIKAVQLKLDARAHMARKDRFWSAGLASVVVGLLIAKKIGLVQFDMVALLDWVCLKVKEMRHEITTSSQTPGGSFSQMLSDLAPGFIVTDIMGDKRTTPPVYPTIIREPKAPYTGRIISDDGVGYLVRSAMARWCVDHQVSLKAVLHAALENNWLIGGVEPVNKYLAKGTPFTMGQMPCHGINWVELQNSLAQDVHMARVLTMMKGK